MPKSASSTSGSNATVDASHQLEAGSAAADSRSAFQQAYFDYLIGLQNAQLSLQRNVAQILRDTAADLQKDLGNVLPPDAQRKFVQTLKDAWGREDFPVQSAEAHRQWLATLQEARAATQRIYEEKNSKLSETLQQTAERAQREARDRLQEYLRSLGEAWSRMSVETVDANTLATIGMTLMSVASTAGAVTQGSGR